MSDITEIERRLERLAAEPAAAVSGDAWPKVQAIERRRRRNSAALRVAAIGTVVAGGVLAFAVSANEQPDGMVVSVSAPVSTSVTTSAGQVENFPATSTTPVSVEPPGADTSPTLLDTHSTEDVAASVQRIDGEIAQAWGSGVGPDWLLAWNGGFLALGTFGESSISGYTSPDGLSWVKSEFALPAGVDWVSDVTVGDGRLVAVSTRRNTQGSDDSGPVVLTTTDLTTWTTQAMTPEPLPVALPVIVQRRIWTDQVIAGTDRWLLPVSEQFELDVQQIVENEVGQMPTGWSSSFGDDRIAVDYFFQDGTGGSTTIVYADLGLDPAVLDLVRSPVPAVTWSATWDGQPERFVPPPTDTPGDFAGSGSFIPVDGAFVSVARSLAISDDGTGTKRAVLSATFDGATWSPLDPPDDIEVVDAFALSDGLGVVGRPAAGHDQVFRVDIVGQTWQPLEISGLPEQFSVMEASPGSAGRVLWLNPNADEAFDVGPTVTVVAQTDYILTWTFEFPNSSYEVRRVDTGDVVVAESIDLREVSGSFEVAFDHLTGGITDTTIVDPATGAVIMEISAEDMERAQSESAERAASFEPSEDTSTWIAATSQSDRWFVADLDAAPDADGVSYVHLSAASSGVVIVRAKADWFRIDLN